MSFLQVSITLKTVDDEDMSDMLKPEVLMSNGNSSNVTVHPINGQGQESYIHEKERQDDNDEDDDNYYPMNFLELNHEPQGDNEARQQTPAAPANVR